MATARLPLPYPYALEQTLFSGQAFRWKPAGSGFDGWVAGRPVSLRLDGGAIEVVGPHAEELSDAVARYLRVADPMDEIYRSLRADVRMSDTVDRWRGLHLLAQDPWETTAAFILSSASNIPRIARSIDALCVRFGQPVAGGPRGRRAFPRASTLASAPSSALAACGLGYRARYLKSTAGAVASGAVDFDRLARLPTEQARDQLVGALDGVGPKVAECILLFSMGKDDAFPVDRWVQRTVLERYHRGRPMSAPQLAAWGRGHFGRWAGYAQQYLFQDARARGRLAPAGTARSRPRSQSP